MKEMRFTKEQIEKQMRANHCTREEALDILAWDYDIEHGDKEKGAMTKEQKALVRSLTKADKDPAKKRTVKRERKIDEDKKFIHDCMRTMFEGMELNGKIASVSCKHESEIAFVYNGAEYTVKLVKHRAPKE